ncbi:MAG: sigma 54-interacting transcriptional regulator, partial [Fimbriiglobus sp.]
MTEPAVENPSPKRPVFPWRAAFDRTRVPVFVVGGSGRLRYANPAWDALTGRSAAALRGMRVSARRSASDLGRVLAPPPEAWAGRPTTVRRPPPDSSAGPPWWDITFLPLPGAGGRAFAVVGTVEIVGNLLPKAVARAVPAAVAELRRSHAAGFTLDHFSGHGPAADRLLAQARLAAGTAVPVWITGEPGGGKTTLARAIHTAGPTRDRAFVAVDCGAVQPYLADVLLTGKGAVAASGHVGTLYLNEPAALPRDLQDRVAKLVESGGPRLICGSGRPAADDVAAGRLLPVFQAEFAVLGLRLPPLRDRPADLPRFADTLLK